MRITDVIFNKVMRDVIELCMQELNINKLPNIEFIDNKSCISGEQPSFGVFNNNTIQIVVKNRHILDSARTLCHELVHWKQRLNGEELDGSDGSSIENEANAIAGIILRRFGKQHPDCFDYS